MLEPVFYLVAAMAAAGGYFLDWWALVAVALVVGGIVALAAYRIYLRRVGRYYCSSCDKIFRADFLRGRAIAPRSQELPANNALERTMNHRGPRLAAARSAWPAAQLGR
jgi:hypothetical protein